MKQIFKRAISFLMAMVMCISMLPVSALAAEDVPGTPAVSETEAVQGTASATEAVGETEVQQTETEEVSDEESQTTETEETEDPIPVFDPEALVSLEVQSLPATTAYFVGDALDLSGLALTATDNNGLTAVVTEADGVTVVSGDTSESGIITITVAYGNLTAEFEIQVHEGFRGEVLQDSAGYPESSHDYANYSDVTYNYTCEGAEYLTLIFSGNTLLENNYDWIYLYDGEGTELGRYTGSALTGQTVIVNGDTFSIKLTSDGSVTRYGFSFSSISAYFDTMVHEPVDEGVYTEHGCFTDGYTTHSCWICGESFLEMDEGTAAHVYAEGFCVGCGIPENAVTAGNLSDTVLWAITEDNVLYVSGTGAIPDNPSWSSSISGVTEVVVGEGITEIGVYTFSGCTSLQTVSLPDGLEVIDNYAFSNCYSVSRIEIPDSVTTIGSCAFYNCDGLTAVYIPESVETISASSYSYSPFYECVATLKIYCEAETKPEGWGGYWNYYSRSYALSTYFGSSRTDYEFWSTLDTTAESIEIPEEIGSIPSKAFYNRSNLKSVTIPESVTSIGTNAFYNCTGLTMLYIPESVTTITAPSYSESPFYNCSSALTIYCEADAAPEGWGTYWNYRNSSNRLPTSFGISLEDIAFWTTADTSGETFEIPEGITAIPARAFYNCTALTSVTIPDSVKHIGAYAFYGCTGLTELDIPAGVTVIDEYALYDCRNLLNLELPEALTAVSDYMLYGCYGLTDLTIPDNVVKIGNYALYNCYGLTELTISDNVVKIGNYALYNCNQLTELSLPGALETIGDYAFQKCKGLTALELPEGIVSIGSYFLSNANGITELTLPASLTGYGTNGILNGSYVTTVTFADGTAAIPDYALYYASRVKTVTLPNTVTSIGQYAFYYCTGMTEIRMSDALTAIGNYAFYNCSALTGIRLPESVKSIGDYAFQSCTSLTEVSGGAAVETIGTYGFYNCRKLKEMELPAALTQLGVNAFYNCQALTEVVIPAGLTAIPDYAFYGCTALASVTMAEGVASIGNYAFQNCSALTEMILPEGLTTLGCRVFYGCFEMTEIRLPGTITTVPVSFSGPLDGSGVTKVTFGDGFTAIPAYILSSSTSSTTSTYASRIKEVVFEDASKITSMGDSAFYNCTGLESIQLPDGITAIPVNAFVNCLSLKEVILPEGVTSIGNYAFQNCTALTGMILPEGLTTLGYGIFYGCSGITELRIPASVTRINNSGARGPLDGSAITKVIFADGVTTVPAYILSSYSSSGTYASKIREVVFEDASKVTAIGANAFNNCVALESFEIPENVTAIPNYAFYYCQSLTGITIPETVTSIGSYAFYGCTAMTDIVIPAEQTVNNYAYANCSNVKALIIGDNAVLRDYVFRNCSGLTAIEMGDNVTTTAYTFYGVTVSGSCGEGVSYSLDLNSGLMTISGTGVMDDYSAETPAPWHGFASMIRDLEISETVTGIGDYAFAGCSKLEAVVLNPGMETVGESSFEGCSDMVYVEIPDGVAFIGENAFGSCDALAEAAFLGDAPIMEDNVFGASEVEVFYPETASGYTTRLMNKYGQYIWSEWDDTVTSKDIVLLLDVSGSMYGKTDTLSDASTQLIKAIGGSLKKSNIAVVEYDDSTNMLCDFTTNTYRLVRSVANLEDQGGTEYATALNRARGLLSGSTTDLQFVIMFSDGEPNDNKNNIYNLAAAMRAEGTIIYTVGLGANSTQRQVLINVAGSDTRYFEATNIAGLVAAFEELSANFGKSEFATVEMKINGERWDLFKDPYTMCLASGIPISIYLTPGTNAMYDNVASYALEQNGRYVATSTSGTFENLNPTACFQPGAPVYAVLLDANGNVIERKELLLTFTDSFTISYRLGPDMGNELYREETFLPGAQIVAPAAPERIGYEFGGWYASENCEGVDFFTAQDMMGTEKLTANTTVYAKWNRQDTELNLGVNTWTFSNSSSNFNCTHYEMTINDVQRLEESSYDIDPEIIRAEVYTEAEWIYDMRHPMKYDKDSQQMVNYWGGSCFGMSSSVLLAEYGHLAISRFPANGTGGKIYNTIGAASLIRNSRGDDDVGAIESMINFYQIRQSLGAINTVRTTYTSHTEGTDSENLQRIIRKLKEADGPVLMTITLLKPDDTYGGHAVVAYDLEEFADKYSFKVYDCSKFGSKSNPIYHTVEVQVADDGTYTAACEAWETAWASSGYDRIFFKTAMTVEELMALDILVAPNTVSAAVASFAGRNAAGYTLMTNYGDFEITNGTNSAVIENGELISGDLNIDCQGQVNDIDAAAEYWFNLPVLSNGETYTITQTVASGNRTALINHHQTEGFYATHTAIGAGTITFGADGSIASQYSGAVQQELKVTHNDMETPWYTVKISGESTGFTLIPNDDSVTVISGEETTVDITAKSRHNDVTLDDVPVSSEEISVQESEDSCVVVQDSQIIAGEVFGYSVAFNSQMGTNIPTLTNVPYGSLIEEPTDPTKTGYIFEGWFVDEEYSRLWDFSADVVTEDLVLYAGWSVNPNYLKTVTFRMPGLEDQIVYVPKGEKIPVEYAPVDENGEAMEWYTRADYNSDPWEFEYETVTEDLVLYGKTMLCNVSYEPNNGTYLAAAGVYAGNFLTAPEVTKDGWTLCGWYTDAEFAQQWNFETDRVSESMTLYAKWVENVIDRDGNDTGISIEIVNEADVVYTGKAVTPTVIVRDEGKVLEVKADYTVSFKNNTAACDKDDPNVKANKLPQIIVQGKGNYKSSGKITKYFTIYQADMADQQITVPTVVTVKSGNKLQTLKPVVSTALTKVNAKEYTVLYYTDEALTQNVDGITEAGAYYVVLEGNGINLTGVSDAIKVVATTADKLLSKAKITPPKTITSTGEAVDEDAAIRALIEKVVLNKVTWLTAEENLTRFKELFEVTAVDADGSFVSQEDLGLILNSVGKKTVTVTAREGNEEGLVGEVTAKITVKGAPLNKKAFTVTFGEKTPKPILKTPYSGVMQVPSVYTDLEAGVDYTVTYLSGKTEVSAYQIRNAGSYSLVLTGIGSYSGSLTYKFTIDPMNLADAYRDGLIAITSPGKAVYSASGAVLRPTVSFRGSRQLTEGVDYVLKWSNNSKVTDNAAITINGKGNFKGSLAKLPELTYAVEAKPLSASDITVTVSGITIKKDAVTKVSFSVEDGGKKIPAAQYTSSFTDDGETVTLEIVGADKNYTGSRTVQLSRNLIKASDKKRVITSLPEGNKYYYTGGSITPELQITDAEGNDISQCFTVTYGTNKSVGSGTITITGRPDMGYYGTVTVKFTILPKWMRWLFG